MHLSRVLNVLLVAAVAAPGCRAERSPEPGGAAADACDDPGVREVVERFGAQLRSVSLLAEDSIVRREIREAYAPLVTPELLDAWLAEPSGAPGRLVSSPSPERIEVDSVGARGGGECVVGGEVVYVTSTELPGEAAAREPVTLTVRGDGEWRIAAYEPVSHAPSDSAMPATPEGADTSRSSATTDAAAAVDVLREYYAALSARDFHRAYGLWGDGGAASGQTYEAFAAGFEQTARVELEAGAPGRIEGAAGSRYIEVPVIVRALTRGGQSQRFDGSYTLRRSVVEGAAAGQRAWRIYSADLRRRSSQVLPTLPFAAARSRAES